MAASSRTGSIRIIRRPPPAAVRYNAIRQEIAKQLGEVGKLHVQEREKIVADFETNIEFDYKVVFGSKQLELDILVKNASTEVSEGFTVGDLWKALDKTGTRPHTIRPKTLGPGFGGALRFQSGYSPKTRPIGRSGGPGRATGPVVFARQVNHPGFPPRHFSREINKRLKPAFSKAVSRGISLGWKKAK